MTKREAEARRRWNVTILWPEHTGAGTLFEAVERFPHSILLDRDEAHFGLILFQDADGIEHQISIAWPFQIVEEPPCEK